MICLQIKCYALVGILVKTFHLVAHTQLLLLFNCILTAVGYSDSINQFKLNITVVVSL